MVKQIDIDEIKLILNEIINRLDRIEERIINLETKQEEIKESTHNMDSHIHFIENVYDNVKKPLSYVAHKINNFIDYSSSNTPELPSLPNLPEQKS